jgi:hypothetical protein
VTSKGPVSDSITPCAAATPGPVLWDNLTALQPATLKEAQIALFLHKLPRHISALINMRSFDTTEETIQRCNTLWMSKTPEEAASAAEAGPWQHSTLQNGRISPSPYRRRTPGGDKSGRRRSPTHGAAEGSRNDGLCFYHARFGNKAHKCEKGCSYQEN